jgi:hypothetical protein
MKLLKELFSFDEEENDEFAPAGGDDEFNFDFDFENPELDQDLDFNVDGMGDGMEIEGEPDYGAEEDYPEGMMDMPHDDYEEDGEGGLEDDLPNEQEELDDIKGEIASLFARLGKLAAAGDLGLMDDEPTGEMGDEMDMAMQGDPEFATFDDLDMGYEDETMSPDFEQDPVGVEPEMGMGDEMDMDGAVGQPQGDMGPTNRGAPPLETDMNSRFQPRRKRPQF